MTPKLIVYLFCLAATACGGSKPPPESAAGIPAAQATETRPPATFAEQVVVGQKLYEKKCASCHGTAGEGGEGPAVIGLDKGALPLDPPATARYRKNQFRTVGDIAEFLVTHMPVGTPGMLTADRYYSILAFDMKANGMDLGNQKLDAVVARTVTIPR